VSWTCLLNCAFHIYTRAHLSQHGVGGVPTGRCTRNSVSRKPSISSFVSPRRLTFVIMRLRVVFRVFFSKLCSYSQHFPFTLARTNLRFRLCLGRRHSCHSFSEVVTQSTHEVLVGFRLSLASSSTAAYYVYYYCIEVCEAIVLFGSRSHEITAVYS
jgi:hypothetical protein